MFKLEAFFLYIYMRWRLRKAGYESIKDTIQRHATNQITGTTTVLDNRAKIIIAAIDRVVALYEKGNPCLYRSLIGASMLGRRGYVVRVKIGIRFPPFESHAWLEFGDGLVIFSHGSERYQAIN